MAAQSENSPIWVQTLLPIAVAAAGGLFSLATFAVNNARIDAERDRVRDQGVFTAIADMSRQVDRMAALCEEGWQIRTLNGVGTNRERGCYEAWLEARSLLFVTRSRIAPGSASAFGECNGGQGNPWTVLRCALLDAGATGYAERQVIQAWDAVLRTSQTPYQPPHGDRGDG